MSATYESLIDGRAGQLSVGRPARSAARLHEDEPTVLVRVLPVVCPKPSGSVSERVGKALVSLRGGNRAERMLAARALGDVAFVEGHRVPEAVIPLTVTLKSDVDPAVRQEAAWSLWKLSDERAHRPLIAALVGDRSTRVREKAARALGLMGVRDAAPVMMDLIALGKHVPARLRAALAASLGFLAEEEALPLLFDAAEDAEPAVRLEAVHSLGRYLIDFKEEVKNRSFARLSRYIQARKEPQPVIRQAAIKALRLSPEERANIAVARAAVQDPDSATRELAAEALVLWDSEHSERALIEMLADDVWSVRKAAARSLARFISRYGVHASGAACEALSRIVRMFPSASKERRLAEDVISSL